MIVIGLTGQPLSGKDTVADFLALHGYAHISTSDILRQEMAKHGIATDRVNMNKFVIAMRKQKGNGYLAQEAAQGVVASRVIGNTVISGLRNTTEVRILKEKFGKNFILVAVTSPIEIRYSPAQTRGRIGDNISFEAFKGQEEAERKSADTSFEVDKIISMADVVIENKGTKEDFANTIEELIEKINSEKIDPKE